MERLGQGLFEPPCRVDAAAYQFDPVGTLAVVVPGVRQWVEDGCLRLPAQDEWYTIERAQALLGYEPAFNFGAG